IFVAKHDIDVSTNAGHVGSTHRTTLERRLQLLIAHPGQRCHIGTIPHRARLPSWILGTRGHSIPWADFLADVAAVDMSADTLERLAWNRPAQFNSEIGHTSCRIEHAWSDERLSRTCF